MKKYLIRLTDEKDIFYDSEDKLYRYRMYCPYCGKESGCRCFDTLEKAIDFMIDGAYYVCSSKCALITFIDEQDINSVGDTMKDMSIIWRLKWYIYKFIGYISEKDAHRVIDQMDLDYDPIEGESC